MIKGDPWNGYQANQVIVIEPTVQQLDHLVLVNLADNTWLERRTGDDGAQDKTPEGLPPYDPAESIPSGPLTPEGPAAPTGPGGPTEPTPPTGQSRPVQPSRPLPKPPSPPRSDPPAALPPDLPDGPAPSLPQDAPQDAPQAVPPYADPGLPTGPDGVAPEQADPHGYDPSAPYDPYLPRTRSSPTTRT